MRSVVAINIIIQFYCSRHMVSGRTYSECLDWDECCVFSFTFSPFFFFFFLCMNSNRTWIYCSRTIHVLKNIKNRSFDTIYTFKNYFVTVLSVFNFNDNKLNSNGPQNLQAIGKNKMKVSNCSLFGSVQNNLKSLKDAPESLQKGQVSEANEEEKRKLSLEYNEMLNRGEILWRQIQE